MLNHHHLNIAYLPIPPRDCGMPHRTNIQKWGESTTEYHGKWLGFCDLDAGSTQDAVKTCNRTNNLPSKTA